MAKLPHYVQVSNELEFSRLVCALERVPRTSFSLEHNGHKVLSAQADLLKERPVIYYIPVEKNGQYISYGFKGEKEESQIVDTISSSINLYSPIIKIKSVPPSLKQEKNSTIAYEPLELEDLASLARLSYGYDESPFPLFAFPHDDKWLMGVFMTFNESDGVSYFCHVMLDKEPEKPFLKFSLQNGAKPSFVSNLNEHGNSYLKIIKLKEKHPLVNL